MGAVLGHLLSLTHAAPFPELVSAEQHVVATRDPVMTSVDPHLHSVVTRLYPICLFS